MPIPLARQESVTQVARVYPALTMIVFVRGEREVIGFLSSKGESVIV